ncbi:MAG TPA: aerobic carbon-monoxide dehydrogenase large subunit [Actinomycetota bacterium]|nr:aerobic carbon-monoxide dehydrogenase large subunit [Actinomycetota bacterium]
MTTQLFGQSIPRNEDPRLLTGRGRYTDDFSHDAAQVAFVRSDFAHARIVDIDVSGALDIDGVHGVFTYEDLEGDFGKPLPLLVPNEDLFAPRTQYALAKDEVCYVGEIIAMVVARDRYIAEDAATAIRVDYEPLPVVADLAAAVQPAAPVAHSDMSDNICGSRTQEKGDVDAALAGAAHVFEWHFEMERSAAMPMEARAVVARYDAEARSLLLYASTQAPTGVRGGLALLFGLDPDNVHVVAPDVGGGFGMKVIQFYPEEVLCPWASRRLGLPVKWTEDRREDFIGSNHERGQVHDLRVGVDEEGRILAMDVKFLNDAGAYCSYGLIIPIITSAQMQGPYDVRNFRYEFRNVFTNRVPTSPYRGAGRPHAVYVMERVIDKVARELHIDPTEVRRRNFVPPDAFPHEVGVTFQDGGPTVYDSGEYEKGLDVVLDVLDYAKLRAKLDELKAKGRRVGLGFGYYVEGTGIGPYEGAVTKILADGTVTVAIAVGTQGQGHATVFAQIAADELGLPVDRVNVISGDTRRIGYGVGTFASRSAVVVGNAVHKSVLELRKKAAEVAARTLEVAPEDLVFADGRVHVTGAPDRGIPLGQLATISNPLRYAFGTASEEAVLLAQKTYAKSDRPLPEGTTPGLDAVDYYSPASGVFAFGVHAVLLEVDGDTCDIKFHRYVVHHDCGRIINPMIVDGQIRGGVAQGVGGAFYERFAYDDQAQLTNASFMDFLIPYATEVPPVEVFHTETPSPSNPLGIKGVGEAGTIPANAAIANALSDALGVDIDKMPVSPLDLYEIIHGRRDEPTIGRGS